MSSVDGGKPNPQRPPPTPPAPPVPSAPLRSESRVAPQVPPEIVNEDEDLFDFPLVEFGAAESAVFGASAHASILERVPAPLPANAPASSAARGPDLSVGDGATQAAPVASPSAGSTAATGIGGASGAAGAPPAPIANSQAPEATTPSEEVPSARPSLRRRLKRVKITALVIVALNVGGLVYLSAKSVSLSTHAEDLRTQIDLLAHDVARRGTTGTDPHPENVMPSGVAPVAVPGAAELGSIEIARAQLAAGWHVEARKRLFRALAQVDLLPDSLRKQVESSASFLVAESYHLQAEALRRSKR